MEQERPEGFGKLIISAHERIPRGMFCLSVKEGTRLVTVFTGSFTELGDSFAANGEARSLVFNGTDIYFLYNPEDLKNMDLRKIILPPGMEIDY